MAQTNPRVNVRGSANASHQSISNTHGALTKAAYETSTQNSVSKSHHLVSGNASTSATISGLTAITMPLSNNNQYAQMRGHGLVVK